jgi:hypothetical protein
MQFNISSFIHEDGKRNMLDSQENEVFKVDMEVDNETYPLGNITDLNQYLDVKPPERMEQGKEGKLLEKSNDKQLSKKENLTYRSYKPENKKGFFFSYLQKKTQP